MWRARCCAKAPFTAPICNRWPRRHRRWRGGSTACCADARCRPAAARVKGGWLVPFLLPLQPCHPAFRKISSESDLTKGRKPPPVPCVWALFVVNGASGPCVNPASCPGSWEPRAARSCADECQGQQGRGRRGVVLRRGDGEQVVAVQAEHAHQASPHLR
jgi:hypothetical protein